MAPPQTTRDRSLDVAKGLAITAIVVSHVLRGLAGPDTVPRESTAFLEADDALYSFHVAVFALVAGVFLPGGVDRRGRLAYLRPRVALFAYLYLLWTVIQAGAKQIETTLKGEPVDIPGFLLSFFTAYGQLWWLAFMILATVAAVAARPWLTPARAAASSVVIAVVSLAAWGWTGEWVFQEGVALLAFFWFGMLAGRDRLTRVASSGWAPWIALGGLGTGIALLVLADPMPPTSWLEVRTPWALLLGVVTSTSLCAGVLALSGLLSRSVLAEPLALFGSRSLEIFLAHILAITAAHAALEWLGVESFGVHVVIGTAAGLGLSLALWWVSRRAGFHWLFELPTSISRRLAPAKS